MVEAGPLQPRTLATRCGEQLQIKKEIGRGGFAAVYKGVWSLGNEPARMVALKVLLPSFCTTVGNLYWKQFVEEATLLKRLSHKHIVACFDLVLLPPAFPGLKDTYTEPAPCMLLEFVQDGTVQGLIQEQLIQPHKAMYNLGQAYSMAIDIGSAVASLHSLAPTIIHRDLKLDNMLLTKRDGRLAVKLTDFGLHTRLDGCKQQTLRRTTDGSQHMGQPFQGKVHATERVYNLTHETGSPIYMAPEVYTHQPYNEKADVFSFGVLMYEIFGRTLLVFTHIGPGKGRLGSTEQFVEAVALQGWRPTKPHALGTTLWRLIEACWQADPNLRPSMLEVVGQLQELMDATAPCETGKGESWLKKGLGKLF